MATYLDFMKSHSGDTPKLRRFYYVCGTEGVLRLLVTRKIRALVGAAPYNTTVLNVADVKEKEVWTVLNQHGLDTEKPRLVIVHEAHRLTQLPRLVEWLKVSKGVPVTAVFTSSQDDWEDESEEHATIMKSTTTYFVRCSLPKEEADRLKRSQEIITSWGGNIDWINAGILAQRVGYSMDQAWAVMQKASLFPSAVVSTKAIETLTARHIDEEVVWNLVACHHKAAVEAVQESPPADLANILASLGTHVEALGRLNPLLGQKKTYFELSKQLDLSSQYVRMLLPHARLYPKDEAVRRTMLLARMDAARARGATEGVLESLIAAW